MNETILYVGGSKGGVGKSKLSFALIDYLIGNRKKVLLLETDTSNPDTYKAHHPHENDNLVCKIIDRDVSEGWIKLVNYADKFPEHVVVINSAARSNTGIQKYGEMLRETLGELDRELVTFWMLNRQRDSLELLRGFLNSFPDALIYACRNMYFGHALSGCAWNENYFVRSFLQYNDAFEILLFGDFLGKKHPELLRERMPLCLKNTGGSLWLRKK